MKWVNMDVGGLTGAALDWAVAVADIAKMHKMFGVVLVGNVPVFRAGSGMVWAPSTNWGQGGRIIQEYKIDLVFHEEYEVNGWYESVWEACLSNSQFEPPSAYDPIGVTPLIAACRAFVFSRMGDTIQVPAKLMVESNNGH